MVVMQRDSKQQGILRGLARACAAAVVMGAFCSALQAQSPPRASETATARFVPTAGQLQTLQIETVGLRDFRTRIVTDGYIAPDAGPADHAQSGMPVTSAQVADLLQAQTDLATASTQVRLAQGVEHRQQELYKIEGSALKEWQQAQADLAAAQTALESARSRLHLLGQTDAQITAVEQAQANPDAHSRNAFGVRDFSRLWVVANVRESDMGHVRPGDDVEVRVPAYPEQVFRGAVSYVAPLLDAASHRLVVGARVKDDRKLLKPNMQATVTLSDGAAAHAPAVPENAVIHEGDNTRLWMADADGALQLRKIVIGRIDDGFIEVTQGLTGGERVVTAGALFIDQAGRGE
jgi:cobalt-zinc-cadmium efflux system membrane fusion protein